MNCLHFVTSVTKYGFITQHTTPFTPTDMKQPICTCPVDMDTRKVPDVALLTSTKFSKEKTIRRKLILCCIIVQALMHCKINVNFR